MFGFCVQWAGIFRMLKGRFLVIWRLGDKGSDLLWFFVVGDWGGFVEGFGVGNGVFLGVFLGGF